MTDSTPDTVNELMGAIAGAPPGWKVAFIDENDHAALGIWNIYYRRPHQKWSKPLSQYDWSQVKVHTEGLHMDDFVMDMVQHGNKLFPGYANAVAFNDEAEMAFSFGGTPADMRKANAFVRKMTKKNHRNKWGFGR